MSIQELQTKNLPFVLFKEPGGVIQCVIQTTPLIYDNRLKIDRKGFYVYPFSTRERSKPIFLQPDHHFEWSQAKNIKDNLPNLGNIENSTTQEIHCVNKEEYTADLRKYLNRFQVDGLKKAIYSRVKKEDLLGGFDIEDFFIQLSDQYPKAFTYLLNIPGDAVWVGASPELLLSYHEGEAKTVALAGTLKITKNLSAPEWTRKEIDEHRLVENHIIEVCNNMELEYVKSPVRSSSTGKVYHLKSDFILKVGPDKIGQFLNTIHPTPAISGLPQNSALDLIYEIEKYERSYYCGFLGWVEDPEDFSLFINLRCMKKVNNTIYFFAGGGITSDSDIQKEWEETEVKMTTLTDLLPLKISYSV